MAEISDSSKTPCWSENQTDTRLPEVCGLCKTNKDVVSQCIECDEFMCQNCTSVHQNIKLTKDHQLKTLKATLTRTTTEEQSVDTPSVPKPTQIYCSVHSGKKAKLHCYTDDCLVCTDCLLDYHKGHHCAKLEDISQWAKDALQTAYRDLDTYGTQALAAKLSNIEQRRVKNRSLCSKTAESINKKCENLVAYIRSHQNKLLQENDNILKSNDHQLEKLESSLKTHIYDMDVLKSRQRTVFGLGSEAELITERKKIQNRIARMSSDTASYDQLPIQVGHFATGKRMDHLRVLGEMVGYISQPTLDMKVISVFKTRFQNITCICTIDETFWVKQFEQKEINLIDTKGAILKTIKFDVVPICVDIMIDGLILVSSYQGKCLLKMKQEQGHVVKSMINFTHLKPLGVCVDRHGNVLACMVDSFEYDITPDNRRCVQRITGDGNIIQTIEQGEDNQQLFTIPRKVSENPVTQDICVINGVAPDMGYLHILDKNGKEKIVYSGCLQTKLPFDPRSVVCDARGHTIVSDLKNNKVHMLDINGQFLCYLLTEFSGFTFPRSLAIAKGENLVVGFNSGQLCMIRYLNRTFPK